MLVKMQVAYNDKSQKNDVVDQLNEVDSELKVLLETKNYQLQYKYVALIISSIITIGFSYGIMRLAFYITNSNKPIDQLEAAIIGPDFIPADLTIDEIVANDTMIISWDVNDRTPRFFSKWSAANLRDENNNHNMPVSKMTMASAATPTFFMPFTHDGKYFISGENVASSPALFAYMDAVDKQNVDQRKVRVVSVGSTNALPDRIDADVGLLDWATRLLTLNAPVKKHTMDYMMHFLCRDEDGSSRFHKFDVDVENDWEVEFYLRTGSREAILEQKSQEMIFTNLWKINQVLKEVVADSFGC